ncbi:hypothetical protein [Kitasatospora sp. NPDC098663]|uniref:hypothetical protein n=1 Tax=Kitasatospora sp. NPDC098663 TaxID=3364096 RepID=UPI00381C4539
MFDDHDLPRYTHFRYGEQPEPASPAAETLAVPHPGPLSPRGMLIACAQCHASRDFLLIHVRSRPGSDLVFVRCRCAHEWLEPDLEASQVAEAQGANAEERQWNSFEEMYRGLGFDGTFRGIYF